MTSPLDNIKAANNYQRIQELVFCNLRQGIISGYFQPAERLVERDLAEKTGVSRTPIREALRQLELEGLVRYIPRKGAVVSEITAKDLKEIFAIRSVLEGLAAKLAAENINEPDLERVKQYLAEKPETFIGLEVLRRRNARFNELIWNLADSERLRRMLGNYTDYLERFRNVSLSQPERAVAVEKEHRAIIEAVLDGDGERAEQLAKKHIENSHQAYLEFLNSSSNV